MTVGSLIDMQVRIHPDLAEMIRRNVKAHRRIFTRPQSAATFVNEALRQLFGKPYKSVDGVRSLTQNAKTVFGWADKV